MNFPALEKFIERMDIEVLYLIDRSFITSTGQRYICVEVRAYYQKKETYRHYHCWEFTNQGIATYEDGNEVISIEDSIFAYLGQNWEVDFYLKKKALEVAKREFKKLTQS